MRSINVTTWFGAFVLSTAIGGAAHGNEAPVADAGSARYAGSEAVQLDGTASHDPDGSGTLTYAWRQVSGPLLQIAGEESATPVVSGFTQTSAVQDFEFELVVGDGELTSEPDTARVIVVPNFGATSFHLENESFDPQKPTLVYFGGGNCTNGTVMWAACPFTSPEWLIRGNVICFPQGYSPPYARYGHMLIAYLSARAPDYRQPIQTFGWSTGGKPAIEVGTLLNEAYQDARFAINRVTLFDVQYCQSYSSSVRRFVGSTVDGEPCWVDNYVSSAYFRTPGDAQWSSYPGVLTVWFDVADDNAIAFLDRHALGRDWYGASLTGSRMNDFNGGVVAGAYWSVLGSGKNLQLATTTDRETYKFEWFGGASDGHMELFDSVRSPGRMPEPVTLGSARPADDGDGVFLTCEESENAVVYELLIGSVSDRVADYDTVSETPTPPNHFMSTAPFEKTWWTVRVRDQHGSTIYADPIRLDLPHFRLIFRRGDCNGDGSVNVSDAPCALNWLFEGATAPGCVAALNTNGDDELDIADPVALLNYLFAAGSPPVEPFPACGAGVLPVDSELGCEDPPDC